MLPPRPELLRPKDSPRELKLPAEELRLPEKLWLYEEPPEKLRPLEKLWLYEEPPE